MQKLKDTITIMIIALLIGLPLMKTHFSSGELSENENRFLAEFPQFDSLSTRILNREFMIDVEDWLNDHIGLRSRFRLIYAYYMNHLFHISTSDSVILGRSGFCYYTKNNNLDIAKGNYPLSDSDIAKIVITHHQVSDYYRKQGIRYFLALTPSKVSVYPEYLPFETPDNKTEPSEIVENALLQSGSDNVINIKPALLAGKNDEDLLFFRTDSHWNQRGTYIAYREIMKYLCPSTGILVAEWTSDVRTGDLYKSLGLITRYDKETVPVFSGANHSRLLEESELSPSFLSILKSTHEIQGSSYVEPAVYVNDSIPSGTLVIYGDSMTASYLNLPQYLSEHFHCVIQLRLRKISPEIDDYLDPDIVLYSTTERFVKSTLTTLDGQL